MSDWLVFWGFIGGVIAFLSCVSIREYRKSNSQLIDPDDTNKKPLQPYIEVSDYKAHADKHEERKESDK